MPPRETPGPREANAWNSQAYVEFKSQQAATAVKHYIDSLSTEPGQSTHKKIIVSYSMAGLNPFRTLPKDGTSRGSKDMQNRSSSGPGYEPGQAGNFRGNYRGRGGAFNQHRGNMHANQGNFNRNNFAGGGGGGNMGGGYNNQMFNNPMGGGNFGFNRGGMMNMGGMPRGGANMRGGRGGMGGNMMGMNPMGGMPNPMGGMGMMGGGMQGTYDAVPMASYCPVQRSRTWAGQRQPTGQALPPHSTIYPRRTSAYGGSYPFASAASRGAGYQRSLRDNPVTRPPPPLVVASTSTSWPRNPPCFLPHTHNPRFPAAHPSSRPHSLSIYASATTDQTRLRRWHAGLQPGLLPADGLGQPGLGQPARREEAEAGVRHEQIGARRAAGPVRDLTWRCGE